MVLRQREPVASTHAEKTVGELLPNVVRVRLASAPKTWLLVGDKVGDNRQVELISNRLTARFGWLVARKRLSFKPRRSHRDKVEFRADLSHVDWARSDAIAPPWPDIVLTIGRQPSMVALWIKERSRERAKVVIVGRPRRMPGRFDLIVAAAHHLVPSQPNVVNLSLPLIEADHDALQCAQPHCAAALAMLPRPVHAVLVGGPTKPHMFDSVVARALAATACEYVRRDGGSLWVATSPRTSSEVADALERSLPESARFYRWSATDRNNPYWALLSGADRFIVTGDSISMLVEVARLGKPLAIYALPDEPRFVDGVRLRIARRAYRHDAPTLLKNAVGALQRHGWVTFPRDVVQIHEQLLAQRMAVRAGEPFLPRGASVDVDVDLVADRVRALYC